MNIQNKKNGKTALHFACEKRNEIIINMLLESGANFEIKDN